MALENIDPKDRQCLQDFMRIALFDKAVEPDLSVLGKVSDRSLIAFAYAFAAASERKVGELASRTEALVSIRGNLHTAYENASTDDPNKKRTIKAHGVYTRRTPATAVGDITEPDRKYLDVSPNITLRILRFYRKLGGWVALSTFAKDEAWSIADVKSLLPRVIDAEKQRYATLHPTANADAIDHYIQEFFVAITTPEMRNKYKPDGQTLTTSQIWIDLSPEAQERLREELSKGKLTHKGEYARVLARPFWKPLGAVIPHALRGTHWQPICDLLDKHAERVKKEYLRDNPDASSEDATRWVQKTFMCIFAPKHPHDEPHDGHYKGEIRVIGHSAQEMIAAYLRQHVRHHIPTHFPAFEERPRTRF